MDPPTAANPEEQGESLPDFFERNGASWGAADLFMLGARGAAHRLAEFIAILLGMVEESGSRPFRSICVAMPPGDAGAADLLEKVKAAFPEAVKGRTLPTFHLERVPGGRR